VSLPDAEFDQVVQSSRDEAEQAKQLIPDIEEKLQVADSSTSSALAALSHADRDASLAETLAVAAQNASNAALIVRHAVCVNSDFCMEGVKRFQLEYSICYRSQLLLFLPVHLTFRRHRVLSIPTEKKRKKTNNIFYVLTTNSNSCMF